MKKFKVYAPSFWNHHRSGWKYCVNAIRETFHDDEGTALFTNSVEKKLIESNVNVCYENWVGFLHLSRGCFESKYIQQKLIHNQCWKESFRNCCGLYVLSNYLHEAVEQYLDVKVETLIHPTESVEKKFKWSKFKNGPRRLIFIGHWLRKLKSLNDIFAPGYLKTFLNCGNNEKIHFDHDIEQINYLTNDVYDDWLSKNIVFIHLQDSSANNIVIECIIRDTPLLVNRLPALEEYLGTDYPLFFTNIEEASSILQDESKLYEAHRYLSKINKNKFSVKNFVDSIKKSSIYKSLG